MVKEEELVLMSSADTKNELREVHGTKMAILIQTIKDLTSHEQNRVLIFSQFDQMLQRFGVIMQQNGIRNSFVKGNVHVRNKAIREFQDGGGPQGPIVLLLSLSSAASGTDLCTATHVVMIDPVVGTTEEASAVEAQAIGRAFRQGQKGTLTVLRFIAKATIEERLHKSKFETPGANSSSFGYMASGGFGYVQVTRLPGSYQRYSGW
jgi:SNF2 family DNA or RNA helicase